MERWLASRSDSCGAVRRIVAALVYLIHAPSRSWSASPAGMPGGNGLRQTGGIGLVAGSLIALGFCPIVARLETFRVPWLFRASEGVSQSGRGGK